MKITVSEMLQQTHPGACVGVLALQNTFNLASHPALAQQRAALEVELRQRHAGQSRADLKALPAMAAYVGYYKKFKKTYHVLLQLESVVFKEQPIPAAGVLIEAMFMAELNDGLLTAGHDMDTVEAPLDIRASIDGEPFMRMNGQPQPLKGNDIIMADARSVICSINYGSDQRTRIHAGTKNVLYVTYAPPGITAAAVAVHQDRILDIVRTPSPGVQVAHQQVYGP
jgi:DNA/RNA-binding domain of Phe-tRNA-synthetase-like protein